MMGCSMWMMTMRSLIVGEPERCPGSECKVDLGNVGLGDGYFDAVCDACEQIIRVYEDPINWRFREHMRPQ